MPKYQVNVTFDLDGGEQEPEINSYEFASDAVEEFEDNSYFQSTTLESSGGDISFVVEAEDEYAAESTAREVVDEGREIEDGNGWTWVVSHASYDIEEIETPMTYERAEEILRRFAEASDTTTEEAEAVEFVLVEAQKVPSLQEQVNALRKSVEDLTKLVADLQERLVQYEASQNHVVEPS